MPFLCEPTEQSNGEIHVNQECRPPRTDESGVEFSNIIQAELLSTVFIRLREDQLQLSVECRQASLTKI